jgi:glycosyltransferase involved in cell wall biosynthesis
MANPRAARNAGIEAARGDVLAFIDADMWVESDWLQRVRDRMTEDYVRYLGCNVQYVAIERTVPARYLVKQNRTLFEWYLRADSYAPAGSLVVTRDVVDEVGGFDPRLCSAEDYEFGRRVERTGIDQVFAQDIVMYHPARSSVVSLLRRQHRIGRGKAQLSRYDDGLDSGTASFESKLRRDAVVMRETLTDEPLVLQIFFLVLGVLLKSSALAGRIHERLRAATAIAGGS